MKEIKNLTSLSMVEEFVKINKFSFLYISRPDCGVCHAILPQLRYLLDEFPMIRLGHINANEVEEIAAKYLILTVPTLLLFLDGEEYLRILRFVHFDELKERIERIYEIYN